MLRGRRLLLPQSPLSRWGTTAPTTTALACQASSFTPQTLDDSALAKESQTEIKEKDHAKEEDKQDRASTNTEAETEDLRRPRALAFRKYAIDRTVPLESIHVYAKVPRRYLKLTSSEEELLDQQQEQGRDGRHSQESPTSWTTQAGFPQLPVVQGDNASQWTEEWVNKVGKRLGLSLSKRDDVFFKLSIARRMGLKARDPRLASPAMTLAAIAQRERLAKKVTMAKSRQNSLILEGAKPPFPPRNFESKGDPTFKSKEAKLHWGKLEAEGKAGSSKAQTKEPNTAEITGGGLVSADLRDSLRDAAATASQAYTGKSPLVEVANDHTEAAFHGSGLGLAGEFEHSPQILIKERATAGIRSTVRPTWLPFDNDTKQPRTITKEEEPKRSSEGATGFSPMPKARSENQLAHHSMTDSARRSISQLDPTASDIPSIVPDSKVALPEHISRETVSEATKPKETRHNIFGMLFPETTDSEPEPPRKQVSVGLKGRSTVKRRAKSEIFRGGIYKKLFPDDVAEEVQPQLSSQPQPEETEKQQPLPNEEDLVPPEQSIFVSLRNEIRNWIPEEERKAITAPEPGEYGSHSTVLILSGLSNSLVDTDFYRILPEAKHIEGWAGGLVKVVQARDALSYEPVGRYFLMFHSRPAADAYKAEVLRLHSLSKRLLHSPVGKGPLAKAPANPQPFLTAEEKAAVRAFTLCPPTAPLRLNMHMWNTNLVREIAQSTDIADVVQALRPDVATPSKVLVTVNTIPGTRAGPGGGLTSDELWLTLRDDGRERGAPWVLSSLKEGIMPVKVMTTSRHGEIHIRSEAVQAPLEGPIYDELDMLAEPPTASPSSSTSGANKTGPVVSRKVTYDARHDGNLSKNDFMDQTLFLAPESSRARTAAAATAATVGREEKFNRFVLTFTQPAVARRFVRSWHRRAIWDAYEKRSVSIDAVALM